MRFAVACAVVLTTAMAGCASSCVEVVSEEDMEPLPPEPIGPKGMPAWTPLDPSPRHDGTTVAKCVAGGLADEHDHVAYDGSERGQGSARRLRGRVGVLEIRIASEHAEPWSRIALRHADAEAEEARAFILEEARRYDIEDLTIDIVPWFVTTNHPAVHVVTDGRGGPTNADAVRARAFAEVARATGITVPRAVAAMKKSGYDEVAVMIRLPTKEITREFAMWGAPDGIDTAFVQQTPATLESGTYAHELLHLFGADDLYRLTKSDPADTDDVMGGACGDGLSGHTRIAEETAWAIGWRKIRPRRAYP